MLFTCQENPMAVMSRTCIIDTSNNLIGTRSQCSNLNLSIGSVNQASDYKTVTQKLADAIRSASRGK